MNSKWLFAERKVPPADRGDKERSDSAERSTAHSCTASRFRPESFRLNFNEPVAENVRRNAPDGRQRLGALVIGARTVSNKTGDGDGIRAARERMNERCTLRREPLLQRQIVDKHEIIVELQTVLEAKVNVIIEVSK